MKRSSSLMKSRLRKSFVRLIRPISPIKGVHTSRNVAALTFDDGPHPAFTPELLAILERHRVKATFFMLGRSAEENPDIVKSVAEKGHEIGNHSWDHASFTGIGGATRRNQIRSCANALTPYGNRLFRPPFGHLTWLSNLEARIMRYEVVMWNADSRDWVQQDSKQLSLRLIDMIKPGSIVLLHDAVWISGEESFRKNPPELATDRSGMLEAIEIVLSKIGEDFEFTTVSQLLTYGAPIRHLRVA